MEIIYLAVKENEAATGLAKEKLGPVAKENNSFEVPLESLIVLFVLLYSENRAVKLHLVKCKQREGISYILPNNIFENHLETNFIELQNLPDEIQACSLPVLQDKETCTAGLCSVLRWAIKCQVQRDPGNHVHSLLGFRGGCLTACSEVSAWTKFCESDVPKSVESMQTNIADTIIELPRNLVRLEKLLQYPVRTHNIEKRKLDILKKQNTLPPDVMLAELSLNNRNQLPAVTLNHVYVEGIDKTLADLILFPCVHFIMHDLKCMGVALYKYFPLVCDWYQRLLGEEKLEKAASLCAMQPIKLKDDVNINLNAQIEVPDVSVENLYMKNTKRPKTVRKQDPTSVLEKLKSSKIEPEYSDFPSSMDEGLDWHSLPITAHPAGGDLPLSRVDRKCQQVESVVTTVMDLAIPNDVIVDFCSGGGHVGILLAYYLPKCKVIMIENKEASLQRARERAAILELDNVYFYQCNLENFQGHFSIAVALHACGVATDLVIEKSLQQRAKFVCCPCCYGSVKQLAAISYPRSRVFVNADISSEEFVHLSHCADRTEVDTACEAQGKYCMGLIDTDRSLYVQEHDYDVKLCTLQPPECTPKNNLLIGIPL